jgi:hypothetical protein
LAGDTALAQQAYQKVIELAPSTTIADTAAEEAAGL